MIIFVPNRKSILLIINKLKFIIMDSKTLALVSYIFTPIGFLISFFSYQGQEKNSLVSYHLRQSFGLFLVGLALWVIMMILWGIFPWSLFFILSLLQFIIGVGMIVLMVIGILNASKGEEKPLPIIGQMFVGKFNFIP